MTQLKRAPARNWRKTSSTTLRPDSPLAGPTTKNVRAAGADFKEKLWKEAIARAKAAVSELHKYRRVVAQEAMKVCDVQQGGGSHWSKHDGVYTIRRFADDAGVNYKTLWNWINVERDLVPTLKPGEYSEEDYKFAQKAIKDCRGKKAEPEAVRDRFRVLKQDNKAAFRLTTIVQWTRSHLSFLAKAKPKDLPLEDLKKLRTQCAEMLRLLDLYIPKAK